MKERTRCYSWCSLCAKSCVVGGIVQKGGKDAEIKNIPEQKQEESMTE